MTAILERRENSSLWARFCAWITSTENRSASMKIKDLDPWLCLSKNVA